jgi:hypothetical protein
MFVNSDIVLLDDPAPMVQAVSRLFEKFVIVGQRINVDFFGRLSSSVLVNLTLLESTVVGPGAKMFSSWALDYFIFSRQMFEEIPPFALGRGAYDNWSFQVMEKL